MSANASGRNCRTRSHWAKNLAIYDTLPRELRDRLKIHKSDICAGCIRAQLRREGLEQTLKSLDAKRCAEPERHGREIWWRFVEDLKP